MLVMDTGGAPTTLLPDVMDYGLRVDALSNPKSILLDPHAVPGKGSGTVSCSPTSAARFTFTIRARGSGTIHYTWQPNGAGLSHLPVRNGTVTFTGPTQTENIVYTVPLTGSSGQRIQGGMTVWVTAPDSFSGATYVPFELICP